MATYTVKLMTVGGEIAYPDYRAEKATFTANGNSKDILFTPYNGSDPVSVTAIELSTTGSVSITIPSDAMLSVGTVVKFPAGTLKLTDSQANPLIMTGAPYVALVRLRQALIALMGDNPLYAQQKLPEPKEAFTAIHLLSTSRQPYPFDKTWDGDYRVYHYNCSAEVVIIRSADDAQAFLENFLYQIDSTEGDFWQFENNCCLDRSSDFENSSPLIDNLVYQQMAQVTMSLQFVYQYYKKESWIAGAAVDAGAKQATLTIRGY